VPVPLSTEETPARFDTGRNDLVHSSSPRCFILTYRGYTGISNMVNVLKSTPEVPWSLILEMVVCPRQVGLLALRCTTSRAGSLG
jgi:hypothetical protein